MNMLNFFSSSSPSKEMPTDDTPERWEERLGFLCLWAWPDSVHDSSLQSASCEWEWPCSCECSCEWPCPCSSLHCGSAHSSAPSSSESSSTMCEMFSREKEPIPRSSSRFTREFWHSMILAVTLMDRRSFRTLDFSSGVTRSILLSRILSAKATCCTASLTTPSARTSSRCCLMCLESTRHRIASMRNAIPTSGRELNVKATGAGSAMPVVSMMTASYFSFLRERVWNALTRSPLTVQHTHPLSIEITSSLACRLSVTRLLSMLTSPNSFSMTAIFLPCLSCRM
mmetsp:Transcript_47718/g.116156  ORF Transcript_47718/g.116156 Transcript_47718/m.116156 type:complete len:284 (+) Transcript_47718:345-1196(+)